MKTPPPSAPARAANRLQPWLIAIAAASLLCAVLHGFFPARVDEKTGMFLALAVIPLIVQSITKFKGLGIEFEQKVQDIQAEVAQVGTALRTLEKGVGPGRKKSTPQGPPPERLPPEAASLTLQARPASPLVPDDPNKGRFGGSPEAHGRRLSATLKPAAGPGSSSCHVALKVESTDPGRPLRGTVTVHLHPTFGTSATYGLPVKGGLATDTFTSYGAFTIGVEADDGETRLELDLMDVPGGTDGFYEE